MQVLLDKMKCDPDWEAMSESFDPLTLTRLMEKTALAQTADQCPFVTVCEQEQSLHSFRQQGLSNEQWHGKFKTKVDIGKAVGTTRQHAALLQHVASEEDSTIVFENLGKPEQDAIRLDSEERHISHVFLRQSAKQHTKLQTDLQNDCTTGDN